MHSTSAKASRRTHDLVRLSGEVVPAFVTLAAGAALRPLPALPGDSSRPLTLTLVLNRSDQPGFDRFLTAVENPRSPQFRHFLAQPQLTARFGPSRGAYDAVGGWLRAQGFRIVDGSANRLTLTVRGSRAMAERAFRVALRDYRFHGRRVYTNDSAPLVPEAIARDIRAVDGFSNLAKPMAPLYNTTQKDVNECYSWASGTGTAVGLGGVIAATFAKVMFQLGGLATYLSGPGAVYFAALAGSPYVYCYMMSVGIGFRQYYEHSAPPSNNTYVFPFAGRAPATALTPVAASRRHPLAPLAHPDAAASGTQKLGLLEFDNFHIGDVRDWLALSGSSAIESHINNLYEVGVGAPVAPPGPGESEVLLDVNSVLAASNVPTTVYDASPSTSFAQVFNTMINDGDTIISNSWSQCEDQTSLAEAQSIDSILAQAAASGISVLNGSGDTGSTCLDGGANTVGVPADSPHATAVGASSLRFGPGFTYGSETRWGGSNDGQGSGFGASRYFTRPANQNGLTSSTMRSVPDLVVPGDPANGTELCQADSGGGCPANVLYGGTSLASPVMAALTANLDANLGHPIGQLNAALYPLAGTSSFHSPGSLGSDFAHVGLGSPDFDQIQAALSHTMIGTSSATHSQAVSISPIGADGAPNGVVRVTLTDPNDYPVAGKAVTLTANAGSSAVISPSSGTSDVNGDVTFTASDTVAQTTTFTGIDTTDGVTLSTQPTISFVPPAATGAVISASPATVANDGTTAASVTVYLQSRLGRPASGRTVTLSANGGSAVISPGSGQAVTDGDGNATFQVTDTSQETVALTATDTTDGNLPVPGSATVTFEPQGSSSCSDALPTGLGGASVSQWASGLAYNSQPEVKGNFTLLACASATTPAFDSSGNAYLSDTVNGEIYKLGAGGGVVDSSNALPDARFPTAGSLGGISFGKTGELYAAVDNTLVQVDPSTGRVDRTIVSNGTATSGPFCSYHLAVDPLSGDVFTANGCSNSNGNITRIANPDSASPTVSTYANVGAIPSGIAFAPDGTMYVGVSGNTSIVSVSGTSTPAPPTVSTVATLANAPLGAAVSANDGQGHATALDVTDNAGNISRLDLTANPVTVTTIAAGGGGVGGSGGVGGGAIGPDGCLYVNNLDVIAKVSGACSGTLVPALSVTQTTGSALPVTGTQVGFTASLMNASLPAGTPVTFVIDGANTQVSLTQIDSGGHATFGYTGALTGGDRVSAELIMNGRAVDSAPLTLRWTAGKHVTFLSLNGSQESGLLGQSATFYTQLTDVSRAPPTPVAGGSVAITVQGQTCTASIDSSGQGSCTLTPPGPFGLAGVSASYAGSSTYTASTATGFYAAGGLGLSHPHGQAPPGNAAGSAAPGSTAPGSTAPQDSALTLSPSAFRAASSGPTVLAALPKQQKNRKKKPKTPTDTVISYKDSQAARTTLTVLRPTNGVKSKGGRCVAPPRSRKKRTHLTACTRYVALGSFSHTDTAGANRIVFSGRIRSRRLRPGPYRLSATPSNTSGNGATSLRTFKILR